MGHTIAELPTPALLLDLDRLEANVSRMAARCRDLGVRLRPHIKTHKCIEIAERQREAGCTGITVSTLYEACAFADRGFDDITWAFPVILNRLPEARALAERVTLRLVVDSREAVDALEHVGFPFHVWLKIDCGYHRAGILPDDPMAFWLAKDLAESSLLHFDGILSHSGHAYHGHSVDDIRRIAEEERAIMADLRARFHREGIDAEASVGSTPAMCAVEALNGVQEARPGNYVFYDRTQVALGVCGVTDVAVSVLSSVVSSRPRADHCVVDAGALALSKDTGSPHGEPGMGDIYEQYNTGRLRDNVRLTALSQEHGIVNAPLAVGDRIRILPNHSCLTTACWDAYHVVRGTDVVDSWKIWRGR